MMGSLCHYAGFVLKGVFLSIKLFSSNLKGAPPFLAAKRALFKVGFFHVTFIIHINCIFIAYFFWAEKIVILAL